MSSTSPAPAPAVLSHAKERKSDQVTFTSDSTETSRLGRKLIFVLALSFAGLDKAINPKTTTTSTFTNVPKRH